MNIDDILGIDASPQQAARRRTPAIPLDDGRSIEQFTITEGADVFEFHRSWMQDVRDREAAKDG